MEESGDYPSFRSLHVDFLKGIHSLPTPSGPRSFPKRFRFSRLLLLLRTEDSGWQQAAVKLHFSNLGVVGQKRERWSSKTEELQTKGTQDLGGNILKGFPGGSVVKNPPAMREAQETWVQSLGGEDPLEKGMATTSSTLAWRIPWTEEPGGLQSTGSQRAGP